MRRILKKTVYTVKLFGTYYLMTHIYAMSNNKTLWLRVGIINCFSAFNQPLCGR